MKKHINKIIGGAIIFLLLIIILQEVIETRNKELELSEVVITEEKQPTFEEILAEKLRKKQEYIDNLDLETDSSIQKFVDSKISFTDIGYVPEKLFDIRNLEFVYDTKGNGKIRADIVENLNKLSEAFYEEFDTELRVVSSYRSYTYQKGIKDRGCPDNLCAKAGYSEHQGGLSIDIFSASTEAEWNASKKLSSYHVWMDENAHEYGFHNTYQKGLEIDGYEIEPWHWRFLGVEFATYLKEKDITFAEYYYSKNK